MDNVGKIGVNESVLALANFKQTNQLKKTDGAKRSRVTGRMPDVYSAVNLQNEFVLCGVGKYNCSVARDIK